MTGVTIAAPTTDPEPLLRVRQLKMYFPIFGGIIRRRVAWVRAVDDVSFDVASSSTLGLVGESGSGKSTMGRTVVRLLDPLAGSIRFEGQEISTANERTLRPLRRRMQIVFQDPFASLNPRMTAGEILEEPLEVHGLAKGNRATRVRELLDAVHLPANAATRYPHGFSGGQRQRIAIARALAVEPVLIVADEPVSALDVSIQAQVVNLFAELQERFALSYLFIAHDLSVVRHVSHRVAVMYLGSLVEVADTDALFKSPRHPYTIALISAVPKPDPTDERTRTRILLTGEIPSPVNPPTGCRFHTRCWLRQSLGDPEVCVREPPPLVQLTPTHSISCHFHDRTGSSAVALAAGVSERSAGTPFDRGRED